MNYKCLTCGIPVIVDEDNKTVEPCDNCLDNQYTNGYDSGYDSRDEDNDD